MVCHTSRLTRRENHDGAMFDKSYGFSEVRRRLCWMEFEICVLKKMNDVCLRNKLLYDF